MTIIGAKAKTPATISARVYRAETGEWEDLGTVVGPFHKRMGSTVRRTLRSMKRRIQKWHI